MNAKVSISQRAGASFPVRRMNFNFDAVPEYWMSGNAGLTHFMTALSALFPAGEKFFIDSVRVVRYHPMLKDNAELQKEISSEPEKGDLIRASGGVRKIRWYQDGVGKSGGIRVIYYYMNNKGQIYMFMAYPKTVKDDLTDQEVALLRKAVEVLKNV